MVASAAGLTLFYLLYDRITRPPRSLRHIPRIGYFSYMKALLQKVPNPLFSEKLILPLLEKKDSNGIYLRPAPFGWTVCLTNPQAITQLLLRVDAFPKVDVVSGREGTLGVRFVRGPNLFFLNGARWKKQRKITNPAFRRSMPVHAFGVLAQKLIKEMDRTDLVVNIVDLMALFALDSLGKAGFDFEFNAIENPNNEWVALYHSVMRGHTDAMFNFFPILDRKFLWLFPKRQKIHRDLTRFLEMLDDMIHRKRQTIEQGRTNSSLNENEKDLLTLLIEGEQHGDGVLTDEELKDVQEKARNEALKILGNDPVDIVPTVEETRRLEYIEMVIKETLRIYTPASITTTRIATRDGDLDGTFIPKGSLVIVDMYNFHRSPDLWEDPERFDPDRFASGVEGDKRSGNGNNWIPFGSGGRQCIGMNFSLAEQRVLIPMLLRKYTWTLPEDSMHKECLLTNTLGVLTAEKLYIEFKRRY
ncbi:cytochrome P450-dit2 [Apophysomyces ossiformis]|uniref:Cytochrome P450-dit2 n=1 Tax=Apophysomyces ossiformis TaxID=679940 RepID=A0A8H7ERF7_9FUNG|nr:cytochrome P450-dit2 [Apophysomyces ossiformis]